MIERPRVKFCGMTRREDAVAAADLGVDAVGFVFWAGSPRHVTPDVARDIVRALPAEIERVGVFVDVAEDEANAVATHVGLSAVQIHGNEYLDPDATRPRLVIKPVGPHEKGLEGAVGKAGQWPDDVLLLVDAVAPDRHGGTGRQADWEFATALTAIRPTILAGGLSVKNVIEAVHWVMPFGLDVSSGIESAPGIKDAGKMREFLWTAEYAWACLPSDWNLRWRQRVQFGDAAPRGLGRSASRPRREHW